MTHPKVHRLIICDVTPDISPEITMRRHLTSGLKLSGLNICYDRNEHLSLFIDYCPETKHLEIVGTRKNFDVVGDFIISFKHRIEHSYLASHLHIANWVRDLDKAYLSHKPESYDVF